MSCATYIETFMNQLGNAHGKREVMAVDTGRWIVTSGGDTRYLVDYDAPDNLLVVWRYSGIVPREDEWAATYEKLLEMNTTSWQYAGARASLSADGEIVLCVGLPAHQCNNTSFGDMCRSIEGFLGRYLESLDAEGLSHDLAGPPDASHRRQRATPQLRP